ncbi:equilibrative nucleoside transporter 3-like [Mizuhopecten yessoensis]|uniref:Equilibrative nucleoside transporter 3 n=1 Tax=Mizuhopecten yessoensis TaxID=6573 RepID=A0A210PZD0_MIZYE|nr:equilibrative nucleoside transporter 3-like [Mizuhopecten yessoensis]OWF41845.1 Equilibrative nucleoside transporter 3 [Mizuhopecten yessoensis]
MDHEEVEERLLQEDVDDRGAIPTDRCNGVYVIFCILGLGSLLPWNFFITAKEYYLFKLRNLTLPTDDIDNPQMQTEMQTMFEGSVAAAATLPNLIFNFLTAVFTQKLPLKGRMVVSCLTILVMFVFTLSLVNIKTDTWQLPFFVTTLVTVVILSAGSSVFTASLFGLAGIFPPRYMQAAVSGQAVGGLFAAVANLLTLVAGSTQLHSAFAYFTAATLVSVVTLVSYILLYYLDYSKFHLEMNVTIQEDGFAESSHSAGSLSQRSSSTFPVLKKIWREGLAVFITFAVSLSCFPAICSSITSQHKDSSEWSGKYFTVIVCFLLFNLGDYAGRIVSGQFQWPKISQSRLLLVVSLVRVAFIPLLMLCNAQPRAHLPVVFTSDVYPIVFILLLGLTNGYLCTLCMMYGPKKVMMEYAEFAGASMSVCITIGLASGSLISLLLVKML